MVLGFRKLNEKTIGDSYSLPNINDILDSLGPAKYFSLLDLATGFHHIKVDPKDSHKTAFSTPHGHYEFDRMPFGLKTAPATFKRLLDLTLTGLIGTELFVYLDDIVIYRSFHGRFTVNIFFSTKHFFCLFSSKITDTYFFFNVILENFEIYLYDQPFSFTDYSSSLREDRSDPYIKQGDL